MKEFYRLMARPTVVITTISPRGIPNAAPFSFTSPMASRPPQYGFCCEVEHDTWRNIEQTPEFVVNLVGEQLGSLIDRLAHDYPYEVCEIDECGLTQAKSLKVKPPRIAEAYGWIECRMRDHVRLSDHHVWIISDVLASDIKDEVNNESSDVVDVEKAKPLSHIWLEDFAVAMKITRFKRSE
jgi:flavin reductase (DIM6/NTAB) family NADH-FMN oxidoreductase RutF